MLHLSDVLPVQVDWEKSNQERSINNMMELMKRFVKQEEGQDLVEYALLLVFLALAAIAVLPTLGKAVNNVFSNSASTLVTGS
jgi:pilus assembly protein Flp/PilA